MPERNLNFDQVVDRRNDFYCLKYDFAKERKILRPHESVDGLLPLWIADMDFRTSSYIQDELSKIVSHGIYGYSETKDDYFEAVRNFYRTRHGYDVENPSWMVKTPGVVVMLAMAMNAFTEKGDAVLIQNPVYMHFAGVIESGGRRVVSNDLVYGEDGRYHIDFEDFEKKIVEEKIKLFFLCSPHNPVCRVWTRDELEKMTSICLKHHVLIASDEIHSDFVFEGRHIPTASLSSEVAESTVTITAPTKTFNLAGLQIAHSFIPNRKLRTAILREIDAIGYSQVPLTGIVAAHAAYTRGIEWLDAMLKYVKKNIDFADEFVRNNLPGVKLVPMEATYLAWLDFNGTGKSSEEINDLVIHRAKLWLNDGSRFGETGRGFQRLNLACPRVTLEEAFRRIKDAFYPV